MDDNKVRKIMSETARVSAMDFINLQSGVVRRRGDSDEKVNQILADAFYHERKKVEKLEGWLKYLWGTGIAECDDTELEISDYIKSMDAKEV